MNSLEFTTAINTLSWAVAEQFETVEELSVAGAIFTQIGDTLETIAALRELCGPTGEPSANAASQQSRARGK